MASAFIKFGPRWFFALALTGVAVGCFWWWSRPLLPPVIPAEGREPEVDAAIEEARTAVLAEPRSGEAWGTLGQALLTNDLHPDISLACFLRAEALDAENPRWPYFAAGQLLQQGKQAEATAKLERATALGENARPEPTTPRLLLAETLLAMDQPAAAERHFRHVLQVERNNARMHYGLAVLALGSGDWTTCRTHLELCLGSPQTRKKAAMQLATVCQRLGDQKAADEFAALEARLPEDFDWPDPYMAEYVHLAKRRHHRFDQITRLQAEGRLLIAAKLSKESVEKFPKEDTAHVTTGRILLQMDQLESAEAHVRQALALAPDRVQSYHLLSLILLRRGEQQSAKDGAGKEAIVLFEQAADAARQALARRSDFGYAHSSLGLSLQHLGRRDEALAAFRQALHCNPESLDNHLILGTMLAEAGRLQEARPHLEQAALLAGDNDPRPKAALKKFYP